ncbi:transporter [Micromonospora sp. KC207]|uniref:transporter n=1 Tax=Micromonospora sp. KC207 TaxID=2530377 RepID=UPI001051D5D3|nr:transporter [Micromonospora sp. KC207]TDC59792.1 transporter [Micromonospora sp. KC207]
MIWLTWRQHRKQALVTAIGLVLLAAFMIPTGLAMRHTFADLGLADCVRALGTRSVVAASADTCGRASVAFNNEYATMSMAGILFLVLPLLVGLFWGAPLVAREVEAGTHRMVWTQAVSRRHWALVKFGVTGTGALIASVVYGLGTSWWLTPISEAGQHGRFNAFFFDMQGLAPIGYTLFAVALGVCAGTVWPKVLPAMTATLTGFVGLRVALATLARPHYLPARVLTFPVKDAAVQTNPAAQDWIISYGIRDASGKMLTPNAQIACAPGATGPGAACGTDLGITSGSYNWQLYQPGDRFWLFQSIETGIFVALAALLLYLAIRRIRRIA